MPRRPAHATPPAPWHSRIVGYGDVPVQDLVENAMNWRLHPKTQMDALAGVFRDVGVVQNLLVNKRTHAQWPEAQRGQAVLIDGHARLALALDQHQPTLPVTYVDLTPGEEAEILATLDPLGAAAEADGEKLAALLAEVSCGDSAVQQLLAALAEQHGIVPGQAGAGTGAGTDPGPQIDRAAELRAKWGVEVGQCWQLGDHRVVCGDCTDKAVVERVMQDEQAVLCHADPPYGMGKEAEGIANDNLYGEKLDSFQMHWWQACRSYLADNASIYIWGNAEDLWRWWYAGGLAASERMTFRNEVVWHKGNAGAGGISHQGAEGLRLYPQATERCLFFMLGEQGFSTNADNYWEGWEPIRAYLEQERKKMGWDIPSMKRLVGHSDLSRDHWTSRSQWSFPTRDVYEALQRAAKDDAFKRDYDAFKRDYDDLKRDYYATRAYFDNTHENMTDVWDCPRVHGEERYDHPTPKPVPLIVRIVKSSTTEGTTVYEPFLGSGTTLIACQSLGRRCRGIEIDPGYTAICLERWSQMTGQTPSLVG